MRPAVVSGWGRTQPVATSLTSYRAAAADGLWCDRPDRGVLARGLGRSYGDAAQNSGGQTVELTEGSLTEPRQDPADPEVVRVSAGLSLDQLMAWAIPRGLFVPVSPGTRHVTVGGAIAADVHGKNHHRDGTFGAHVRRLLIDTPLTGPIEVDQADELFNATVGGMGLTGIIVEAEIRLIPIATSFMSVTTERAKDLDTVLTRLRELDRDQRYTVAWMDLLASGSSLGRGVIMAGDHALVDDLDDRRRSDPLRPIGHRAVEVPENLPGGLLNPATVLAFNTAWYWKAPKKKTALQDIGQFFHPLDSLRAWNRLYGPRGFTQYQLVVPDRSTDVVRQVIQRLVDERIPSFLTVLKRFGAEGSGLLSFPTPGWTLTLDLPALPRYGALLDGFDEAVVAGGGRVYFAKDARLHRRWVDPMYPRLDEWRQTRDRYDPDGVLVSDLDRRLNLSGRHR